MARNIEGPKPGDSREFIPASFNNREDDEPIVVMISDPTEAQKRKLQLMQTEIHFNNGEIAKDEEGNPLINVTLEAMAKHQRAAVIGHVSKVTNYVVRGVEIKDGHTLAEHGETELLAEIALEVTTGFSLNEAEKKT